MARLLSLNVGLPRDVAWQGRTVRTATGKSRFKAGAWRGGSTSMATAKAIWQGTAANTALFSCINSNVHIRGMSDYPLRLQFESNPSLNKISGCPAAVVPDFDCRRSQIVNLFDL
jgi:hypothetical protein